MMTPIVDRIRRLYPFAYSVCGRGNDDSLALWCDELPFTVHEFASGSELNGWYVTPSWSVNKAEIRKGSDLVYDGLSSPLGVITQSEPFTGRVPLDELRKHLFYSETEPEGIVYHWTALYRPLEKGWGFCVPKALYDGLADGEYEVTIETQEEAGTMKVLDFVLPGESEKTILLNGHNCHPFQANDDLSGCAVGIEIMNKLATVSTRRFTYRLVIAPELIGTAFWLDALGTRADDLHAAIMLKAVGNDRELRVQESYTGMADIDRAAHHVFARMLPAYESGGFRTIYGNDETVFEAPGYEIPTISLTRWPFDEYHTDRDTPDRLSEDRLTEAVSVTFEICMAMERNIILDRDFKGLVCLSHPRYGLYKRAAAPGIDNDDYSEEMARWNLLMNNLPRDLDGQTGLLAIADKYGLALTDVHDYALKWVERGLAKIAEGNAGK